nr:hypothetical protein [uncultured Pseudomonas sp.]
MDGIIEQYSNVWGDDPTSLIEDYRYQLQLTAKLDALIPKDFDQETLLEIVLWKLNRFPRVEPALLEELKVVADFKPKTHRQAEELLRKLLASPGIRLPMASTILRFLNPEVFQIIDDRAYRMLRPNEPLYPSKPANGNNLAGYLKNSIRIYFEYLDAMHAIVSDRLPFHLADRILYQLDIKLGNKIGDREES